MLLLVKCNVFAASLFYRSVPSPECTLYCPNVINYESRSGEASKQRKISVFQQNERRSYSATWHAWPISLLLLQHLLPHVTKSFKDGEFLELPAAHNFFHFWLTVTTHFTLCLKLHKNVPFWLFKSSRFKKKYQMIFDAILDWFSKYTLVTLDFPTH